VRTDRYRSTYELIWETVRQIPRGKVATYGQVASESGFPGQARLVGYALHNLPDHSDVPWQRVINARGKISFPVSSAAFRRQRRLLETEGIHLKDNAVDLRKYGWPYAPRTILKKQ